MTVEIAVTKDHFIRTDAQTRRIAYTQYGDLDAKHLFVCLPGLLETRDSFDHMWAYVDEFEHCCWISLDYCGRGDSDALPSTVKYATSVYLADVEDFVNSLLSTRNAVSRQKLHLIGTSMGGILAMHLVNRLGNKVHSLVLNDIGLNLHWSSLMALYQQIKNSNSKIDEWPIDPRVVAEVHAPSHFDLQYDFDLYGMQFQKLLNDFSGKIMLLHNSDSRICSLTVAKQSKRTLPQLEIWTQYGLVHPAQWDLDTVHKLRRSLKLKLRSKQALPSINMAVVQTQIETRHDIAQSVQSFMETSQTYLNSASRSFQNRCAAVLAKARKRWGWVFR